MLSLKDPSLLKMQASINGEWLSALSGQCRFLDPATGQQIAEVPDMRVQETQQAICAAEKAFLLWKTKTAKERALILRRWFDLIVEVKNVVTTAQPAVVRRVLTDSPVIRKLSFTASTAVGKQFDAAVCRYGLENVFGIGW
ncbi:aldehyde dehydrogenase family protein [Neptunomonas sp.]|uniref:aldehyde dehydrogenase family protein n=1 Tax=Neptunomonas sp. TaxID=1971898 RepID=UPI003566D231